MDIKAISVGDSLTYHPDNTKDENRHPRVTVVSIGKKNRVHVEREDGKRVTVSARRLSPQREMDL